MDACQRMYGMGPGTPPGPQPWCAMFTGYTAATSTAAAAWKEKAREVIHPSTAVMYERARERGWVKRGGPGTPTGALGIIPGRHVFWVWRSYADGTLVSLDGNSGDAVRANRRAWSDGWEAIVIPGTGAAQAIGSQSGYGFDDLSVKLYGGWATPAIRDAQLRRYAQAHPEHWTQAVRVRRQSPYAFRAGPKGTFDHWRFGPWIGDEGKRIRDEQAAAWQDAHPGAQLRTWRRDDVPAAAGTAPSKED